MRMSFEITNRMITGMGVQPINQDSSAFEGAQPDLATGKRIRVGSDDPAGMSRVMDLRGASAANTQARRNAEDGRVWIEIADSRLGAIGDRLQRVRELVITACNGVNRTDGGRADAAEVAGLRESIATLANSRHSGRPLFGGFVSVDPIASIDPGWVYQGDGGAITRRVAEKENVQINVTGVDLFGFGAGQNLFQLLDDIGAQVLAGDAHGLGASLYGLDAGLNRVLIGRATLGAVGNRIAQALLRSQADEAGLISETVETDLGAAIMELQLHETAYQAAQRALVKAVQPSLAGFLR